MSMGYMENGREQTVSPQTPLPVADMPLKRGPGTVLDLTVDTSIVLAADTKKVDITVDVPGGVYMAFEAADAVEANSPYPFRTFGMMVPFSVAGGEELHFGPIAAAFVAGDVIRIQEYGG